MTTRYFDVVALGTRFSTLFASALLARRGFRVLVLGQHALPLDYAIRGMRWPRVLTPFVHARSPVVRRVLNELALQQSIRGALEENFSPSFQFVSARERLDVSPDREHFAEEIDREFFSHRALIEAAHQTALRRSGELDGLFQKHPEIPPESFLKRRAFHRDLSSCSFQAEGAEADLCAELPPEHAYRRAFAAPAWFCSHVGKEGLSSLSYARAYASWVQSPSHFAGGLEWLRTALMERIHALGGVVRCLDAADQIRLRRGTVAGVRLEKSGEEIGCAFALASLDARALEALLPERGMFETLYEQHGEPEWRWRRYVLNVWTAEEALAEGMARDVFLDAQGAVAPEVFPIVHVHAGRPDRDRRVLVSVTGLLSERAADMRKVAMLREMLLRAMEGLLPFLGPHVMLLDSPHDGRPPFDPATQHEDPVDEPWNRGPHTMEPVHAMPTGGPLGLSGLPLRTPVHRLFLCGREHMPSLGLEGEALGALKVASLVCRADRRKAWMRASVRAPVELYM